MPIAVLPSRRVSVAGALAVALLAPAAQAASIDTENPDLSLRWDNTVKYSNALRLKNTRTARCSPTQIKTMATAISARVSFPIGWTC